MYVFIHIYMLVQRKKNKYSKMNKSANLTGILSFYYLSIALHVFQTLSLPQEINNG